MEAPEGFIGSFTVAALEGENNSCNQNIASIDGVFRGESAKRDGLHVRLMTARQSNPIDLDLVIRLTESINLTSKSMEEFSKGMTKIREQIGRNVLYIEYLNYLQTAAATNGRG